MRASIATVLALALGGCTSTPVGRDRWKADEAYVHGAADAVKELYWAKQALEAPGASRPAGRIEYYEWEDSGTTRDGRKLAPEILSVPVFIPDPAPAAANGP